MPWDVKKCKKKPFGGRFRDLKTIKDCPWCQETLSGLQGGGPRGMNEPGSEPGRGKEQHAALNSSFGRGWEAGG